MKPEDREMLMDYLLAHAISCGKCAYKIDDLIADTPKQVFQKGTITKECDT